MILILETKTNSTVDCEQLLIKQRYKWRKKFKEKIIKEIKYPNFSFGMDGENEGRECLNQYYSPIGILLKDSLYTLNPLC